MNYKVEIRTPYGTIIVEQETPSYRRAREFLRTLPIKDNIVLEALFSIHRIYPSGKTRQLKHGKCATQSQSQ